MNRPFPRWRLLAAALLAIAGSASPGARADQVVAQIDFRPIDNEELLLFATRFFYGHFPSPPNWSFGSRFSHRENWTTVLRAHGFAALVDLDDHGARELVVMTDDPDWCDSDGCLGTIFRPSPSNYEFRKAYEYICQVPVSLKDTAILAQKENGYHLLETKAYIIHWYSGQESDSGNLCSTEIRPK